jgi:gliding motility-associated-like protein
MLKRVLFSASLLIFISLSALAQGPILKAKIGMGKVAGSYCTYTTFTFYDSSTYSGGVNGSSNVNKWYFGDGGTATGSPVTHKYTATGTYIVSLVETNSKDGLKDSTTKQIIVSKTGPNTSFSILGRLCQRSEINFKNTTSPAPATKNNYYWTFGDGSSVLNTDSPGVHVYQNSGTFPASLKDSTAQGCVSSYALSIVIKVTPQAKGTASMHCVDSATSFDASSTITNGLSVSYSWTFPDNSVLNGVKVSKIYNVSKTYQVKLGITNNTNGCNDTVKVNFTVYSKPTVNFGYIPVCQDSIAMFFDSTTVKYGPGPYSWKWTFYDTNQNNFSYTGDTPPDTVLHGFPSGGPFFVTLAVKTRAGCFDSAQHKIYINPTPTPNFKFKNTCQDSAIQFTDSSTITPGSTITGWLWYFGDSTSSGKPFTSTLQNPTHKYAKPGYKYKVKLVAITNSGCRDSITKTVIAYPSPASDFAFGSKCAGQTISFVNNSSMSLTAIAHNDSLTHFLWDFGDGITDTTTNPLHVFTNSGNYFTKLISYSAYGCTDTNIKQVLVYALPVPSFKMIGNCERDSVSFQNTSTTTFGSLVDSSYTWDFGDSVIVRYVKNPHHLFRYSGTFKVKLSATSRQADGTTGCSKDTIIPVTVIPGPHSSFNWVASCFNQPIPFNNTTGSKLKNTITYKWNFGDGKTDTAKNPIHTYTSVKNYNVKLVSTMPSTGCNDSITQFISVAPLPKAYFTATSVCNDSEMIFKDASFLPAGYYFNSFSYDFGDGTTSTQQNPKHKYAAPGVYSVKEVVTSTTNCQDSFTRLVTVYRKPKADFSFTTTCAGLPTQFTDLTLATDSAVTWKWLFSTVAKDSVQNPQHIFHNNDILIGQLTVSTMHGCSDTKSQSVTILYQPLPFFSVPTGCNHRDLRFIGFNNNSGQTTVANYDWDFGDGKTANQRDVTHNYDSSGTFKVVLKETTNQGCVATDTQKIVVTQLPSPTIFAAGHCLGETFHFYDTTKCADCIADWDFGDGIGNKNNDQSPTYKYTTAGTFQVKLWEIGDLGAGCVSDTAYLNVVVNPLPIAKFVWDTACFGDPTHLIDSSSAGGGHIDHYRWVFQRRYVDTTDKSPFYTLRDSFKGLEDTFNVSLKVTTNFGCTSKVSNTVYVKQKPIASFVARPSPATISNPWVSFLNNTQYADTNYYYWNFGDGFDSHTSNPSHKYNDTGTYTVTLSAMSRRGCVDTFRSTLFIVPGYKLIAPNCITINGDGVNDTWFAVGVGVIDFDVVIVDRWGQVVFQATDINKPWKGTYLNSDVKVPEGVYKYYIKAGNFALTDFTTLKGNITVLR